MAANYSSQNKTKTTFIVVILIVIFACISVLSLQSSPNRNTDFVTFWTAGYMAGHGLNPYNSSEWLATRHQLGVTWDPDYIFPYPLAMALLLIPLSFFDYSQAFLIWAFLSQVAILASCILLIHSLYRENHLNLFVPLIAGIVIFRPGWVILSYGQIGAFLLFILSLSVWLLKKEKWFWGGVVVTLIMLKPSLGLSIAGSLFLWCLWQKRWNFIIGQMITGSLLFLLGWLQDKNWVAETIEYGRSKFSSTYGIHPTVWDWQTYTCNGQSGCNMLTWGIILLILLSVVLLWQRLNFRSPVIAMGVIIPLALAFAPYIWMYDHLLCILSIVILMVELAKSKWNFWQIAAIPLLMGALSWFLLVIAVIIGQDIWGMVLPLVCYFLFFLIPARPLKFGEI